MPSLLLYFLLLIPTVPIVREDFLTRRVAIHWLVILGIEAVLAGWLTVGMLPMLLHTAANIGILSLYGCTMLLYHFSHHRPVRDFLNESFGAGDAAMMLSLAPLFSPQEYVRFLLGASIAALIWWYRKRPATIPLAGFIAVILIGYSCYKMTGLWN